MMHGSSWTIYQGDKQVLSSGVRSTGLSWHFNVGLVSCPTTLKFSLPYALRIPACHFLHRLTCQLNLLMLYCIKYFYPTVLLCACVDFGQARHRRIRHFRGPSLRCGGVANSAARIWPIRRHATHGGRKAGRIVTATNCLCERVPHKWNPLLYSFIGWSLWATCLIAPCFLLLILFTALYYLWLN